MDNIEENQENLGSLKELYITLGLDPETLEGDYREAYQKWHHFISNPEIVFYDDCKP